VRPQTEYLQGLGKTNKNAAQQELPGGGTFVLRY
jgi:hypothetical protein